MTRTRTLYQSLCCLLFIFVCCHRSFAATLFVDAQWLATNQQEVVILDARPYRNYFWSHIPGSLSAPWKMFSQQKMKMGAPGWGLLLPDQILAEQIGALGISEESQVVVYADYPGWGDDGRVAWSLKMVGVENVYLLNGGFKAWRSMGGDVTAKRSKVQKNEISLSWNQDLAIDTKGIIAAQDLVIIDTRSPEEFAGAIKYGEARGGHLPNAINLPFTDLFTENGYIKEKGVLEDLLRSYGLNKTDNIVTYCTAGIRSAYMTLVLRSLGYSFAKNYDAGFYDWARNKELPLH